MDEQLKNFAEAFDAGVGTCLATCNCGKTYFDNLNSGISWEEGEYERLESGAGVPAGGSVGFIEFEGRQYVDVCDCWKERGNRIAEFLYNHRVGIGKFFELERERVMREAKSIPAVH